MKYEAHITRILSGEVSISAEARAAGVNPNTLYRELLKHPGYKEFKASGRGRAPGLPGLTPKLQAAAQDSEAVKEVLAGANLTQTALKHNIPRSSLRKMVISVDPEFDTAAAKLKTAEGAEEVLKKAERTLSKARKAYDRLHYKAEAAFERSEPLRKQITQTMLEDLRFGDLFSAGAIHAAAKQGLDDGTLTEEDLRIVRESLSTPEGMRKVARLLQVMQN